MSDIIFILEPYHSSKNRYRCPQCGKSQQFTRYINTGTGEYIAENVGKCNRLNKCGYHYTPKQFFQDNDGLNLQPQTRFKPSYKIKQGFKPSIEAKPITYLDREALILSVTREGQNNFLSYLGSLFDENKVFELTKEYFIGTAEMGTGAEFFQVDVNYKVRQLKCMDYDSVTGKKQNVFFPYSKRKYPEWNLVQCFFGEHLLRKYPNKKVAIVESEKTAIIASGYLPDFIWMAAGSMTGISEKKCEPLKGREVILYPDLGGYETWINKAKEIKGAKSVKVSRLLENIATENEKAEGFDLADYLIQTSPQEFEGNLKMKQGYDPEYNPDEFSPTIKISTAFKDVFSKEIADLESFFSKCNIVLSEYKISPGTRITDPEKFIKSHLEVMKNGKGLIATQPYFDRLKDFKESLENKNQIDNA